jgi:hypothetical protein
MSRENVETVRRANSVFNSGDATTFVAEAAMHVGSSGPGEAVNGPRWPRH